MQHAHATRGLGLVETIVGTALMLVVFVGFLGLLQLGTRLATESKARTGAVALATERMEYLRSLHYDDIGTIDGGDDNSGHGNDPDGHDADNPGQGEGGELGEDYELFSTYYEDITLNGIDYTRRTRVAFYDDPADGTGQGQDENHNTEDYKVIRVSVVWESTNGYRDVVLVSNATPPGIEE